MLCVWLGFLRVFSLGVDPGVFMWRVLVVSVRVVSIFWGLKGERRVLVRETYVSLPRGKRKYVEWKRDRM